VRAGKHLRIHDAALSELQETARRYEVTRSGLGSEFVRAVDAAVERIMLGPEVWPLSLGEHRYVLPRLPFSIYYRLTADTVYVLAIAHQRQQPGYWRTRK